MCLMCDMTGRDHFHISPREYHDFGPDDGSGPQGYRPSTQDTNTSVKTTLNFNSGNNIIVTSEDGTTYRGLSGDDTYILSEETIKANAEIKLIDTEGKNTVQLVDGLKISESLFTSNATRLTLSNGAEITINGADKFTFELSANLTSGTLGVSKTYAEFAEYMGIDSLPTRGSQSGNTNVTINELKTKTDLQTFLSENKVVQSNETLEVSLDNYASFPDAPDFTESTTDLSNRDDLSGLDSIVLYQDYEKATIAIRADKKGIKIFDTSFLNVNSEFTDDSRINQWTINTDASLIYQVWRYLEFNSTNWWQNENVSRSVTGDGFNDFYDITPNSISLGSETFFDSKTNELNYINYNNADYGDRALKIDTYFDTENTHKIQYWWKDDDGDWNSYLITVDSVFDDSTDISIYQDKAEVLQNVPNTFEYEIRDNSYPHTTRDQITIDGSNLIIAGGEENGDTLNTKVTVRAFFKFANGYTFENEEDNYEDIEITVRLTDDDYIRTQSSKIIEAKDNETSISIEEDNPGDVLLDLSDFNIDPGTAKIKTVKINHWEDYDPFEPYISETFYIDEKILKFTE